MKNHTSASESMPPLATPCDPSAAAPPEEVVATRVPPDGRPPLGPVPSAPNPADPPSSFAPVSAAESSALSLSPAQRTALEMLTAGHSLASSAVAAGVHRATLHRWLTTNPQFAAAHNAWQHDAVATARGRLLALTDTAVTAVGRSMAKGDGRLALQLLDRLGLTTAPQPGPTDPADVQRDQQVEQRLLKLERRKAESKLMLDELID